MIATLDDRDLKLEQERLVTERAQTMRERRQAAAAHERAQVRILTAIVASFDGVLGQAICRSRWVHRWHRAMSCSSCYQPGTTVSNCGTRIGRGSGRL